MTRSSAPDSFPRSSTAASLKLGQAGLPHLADSPFSAVFDRGLIEARCRVGRWPRRARFPRSSTAASLKHEIVDGEPRRPEVFSAVFDRGLIEAIEMGMTPEDAYRGFPRSSTAASLKPQRARRCQARHHAVFRGLRPRPH